MILRSSPRFIPLGVRLLHAQVQPSTSTNIRPSLYVWWTLGAVTAGSTVSFWLLGQSVPVRTEGVDEVVNNVPVIHSQIHGGIHHRGVFAWGNNKYNVVSPTSLEAEVVRKPKAIPAFEGLTLRDLILHETFAVAVDEKGDILQWGDGYSPRSEPEVTLKGKNIASVTANADKIFALSRSGKVYCLAVQRSKQSNDSTIQSSTSQSKWWWPFSTSKSTIDFIEISSDVSLGWTEKFKTISAGDDHLLALTTKGRAFALPLNLRANRQGQLGLRQVDLLTPSNDNETKTTNVKTTNAKETVLLHPLGFGPGEDLPELFGPVLLTDHYEGLRASPSVPSHWLDNPLAGQGKLSRLLDESDERVVAQRVLPELTEVEKSIRFCNTLYEIPALKHVTIVQLITGRRHSLALTSQGRALGWGSNNYGQLGLGPQLNFPIIPTPSEVALKKAYPKGIRLICRALAAGNDTSFFVVEAFNPVMGDRSMDVLACGHGQFGEIGNGGWNHQGSPVKVKVISGLNECKFSVLHYENAWSHVYWCKDSEEKGMILPIPIYDITVGKSHIIAVLDNAITQDDAQFGRDVFVWGHNVNYQLGTGKRSNLALPQHLPPLPYPLVTVPATKDEIKSGTNAHMPHNRLQMTPGKRHEGKRIEETVVAGMGTTAVYWKISP